MNPLNVDKEERYNSLKYSMLFILISYLFSVLVRMIWVYQFNDTAVFHWNDELMINTNDGYYFASAVQHFLFGTNAYNPQIPGAISSYPGVVYISAFFVKFFPVSLETTILYMPVLSPVW